MIDKIWLICKKKKENRPVDDNTGRFAQGLQGIDADERDVIDARRLRIGLESNHINPVPLL